jgi:hypothetical protein
LTFANESIAPNDLDGLPEKRSEPRLIICEGHSDKNVLARLIKEHNLTGVQIHIAKGRANFSASLRGARTQGYKAVLVVSDNDDDPDESFLTVHDNIENAGYTAPGAERVTIPATATNPSITVLMIPWDHVEGAIETLCLPALEELFADKLDCLNEFCRCTHVDPHWGVTKRSEMRTECLLCCTQEAEPKIGLGHFVSRGTCPLNFSHACFADVSGFLATFSSCAI